MGYFGILSGLILASIVLFSVVVMQESFAELIPSPKQQLENDVTPENIQCKENRVLVLRSNGNPACVTQKTADRTGWEIVKTEFMKSKIISDVTFAEKSDNAEFHTNEGNSQDVNKIFGEEKVETDTITLTEFDEDEFSFTQFNVTLNLAESKDFSTVKMKLEFFKLKSEYGVKKPLEDIVYKIQILRDGQLLARNLVSTENGISNIKIISNPQCDELDLWRCVTYFNSEMVPTNNLNGDFVIKGPVFTQSGHYDIKINLKNYFGGALEVSWQVNDKVIIPTKNEVVLDMKNDPILTSILETDLIFVNKEIEINPNVIYEPEPPPNWPKYEVTFPRTAQVGVPFDVVYDYAYVVPDEETGSFVNFNEQCVSYYCENDYFSIHVSSYVDVESDNLKFFKNYVSRDMAIPSRSFTSYHYYPVFDNTKPLQETFTFVINEPDINYRIGEINVSIKQNNNDLVYFYVDVNGIILFDQMMTKETFGESTFGKTSAATAIEYEMKKLKKIFEPIIGGPTAQTSFGVTLPSFKVDLNFMKHSYTVYGPDNPHYFPEDMWDHYAVNLLKFYPDVDYREWLLKNYFTEDWVNRFLKAHPELENLQ